MDRRVEAFDAAIQALDRQIKRWSGYAHFVVPDTSFYIEHKDELKDVDFGPLIEVWYPGGQATIGHMREALTASGGLPFEPGAPVGWADGMSAGSPTR